MRSSATTLRGVRRLTGGLLLSLAPAWAFAQGALKAPTAPANPVQLQQTGPLTSAEKTTPVTAYTLQWLAPRLIPGPAGKPRRLPWFAGAEADATTGLPTYTVRLPKTAASAVQLQNARYEAVSAAEAALLTSVALATEPELRLRIGTEVRQPVTLVTVVPLRRNAGTGAVERLVGFDIGVTPGAARRPNQVRTYATSSVLAQGNWVKVGVPETGCYRLDRAALQNLGFDVATVDARNLQVWGNGGRMLPQANAVDRPDDLVETPVWVEETNGSFNALVFYAQGPHGWDYSATTGRYLHEQNLYSDTAYYFLTIGDRPGKRVAREAAPGPASGPPVTTFDEHYFYERELVSLLKQGRTWLGESFDSFTPNRTFDFTLDGIDQTEPAQIGVAVAGASGVGAMTFTAAVNGRTLGALRCDPYPNVDYHIVATTANGLWPAPVNSIGADGRASISLAFNGPGGGAATGYLDHITLNFGRALRRYGAQTTFRRAAGVGAGVVRKYEIGACDANTQVWDVTNPRYPRQQELLVAGGSGSFVAAADSLREYVVLNPGEVRTDVRGFGRVGAQNLHSLNVGVSPAEQLDLVIVTHPQFLAQAERLANHRRQHDGLQVAVVTTTQVWNEFGSGRQDITAIRDLMRLVYARTVDPATYPVNLLLFGDASYDYKSNRWYDQRPGTPRPPTPDNTNFVPVYEARSSFNPIDAFSSEDYFTLMDDDEGYWSETSQSGAAELMDLGVGRLPARDDGSAATLVDKLLRYDAPTSFGRWRNRMTYVADDADGGRYSDSADALATRYVEKDAPSYNLNKLYLDLFPQVSVPSGQRSPSAYRAIEQAVEQGSLIINYIGHGGESGWAAEQILDVSMINNWRNINQLTFMLTATCEFGRYDDPARSSGAELATYNPQGGAVGLFTTTRPVYDTDNYVLNLAFHQRVFETAADGQPRRIGEILRLTKGGGSSAAVLSRNFTLLGDPSMRLAYPQLRAAVTQINGRPAATADTLRALQTVTLAGAIQDGSGGLVADFTGRLQVTVYDKATTVMTLADEASANNTIRPTPFRVRQNILYDGVVSVTNGQWQTTFVVPKDIAYNYGTGKISLYAWSADRDAAGAHTTVVIGGSSAGVADDRTPPQVQLFMNDLSFQNGGTTGADATLIAPLSDDNGINTAGTGIGHEITVVLDGNRQNLLVMNPYYTAEVDSYQKGTVRYLFKGLTPGPHSLTLKAWDTHNNSAERTLDFVVANTQTLSLSHVLNYPNPFGSHTTFHFDHNRPGDDLDVQVQVFTVAGRLVRTVQTHLPSASAHVKELTWDGRDEYGDVLARGVYVYKVNVRSIRDGSHTSKFEKLVVLN